MGFFLFSALFFTAAGATLDHSVPAVNKAVDKYIVQADHDAVVVNDGVEKR